MPIHDWTRVDAGLFHDFHQCWTAELCNALNRGGLPPDYYALLDLRIKGPVSELSTNRREADIYADKANRLAVYHRNGQLVALIEVASPGNKSSRRGFRAFVEMLAEFLFRRVHLLLIDLFAPGPHDPQGIHKALWDEVEDVDFALPPDKPLTLAAYNAGPPRVAYVESVAVGDALPEIPLFLKPEVYVPAPLEATYQTTWRAFPAALKGLLER